MPVAVGLLFRYVVSGLHVEGIQVGGEEYDPAGWLAVSGLLIVGTIGGIFMATFLNNSGGAWDNAKKFIEAGELVDEGGERIGKATPPHAAAVVGDTVGDPFKDTAGPSLHVLVKMLSTITLVLAPLFIA
jgi:K(+)-stimulated pyrophosphate-energized sodium pump